MSNQKLKFGLVAVALSSIMLFSAALPAAKALTPRDLSVFPDSHTTDRFPGGQKICGDKLCSSWEWAHMKYLLHRAQSNPGICAILKTWKECGGPTTYATKTVATNQTSP